jgi:hypothetical protein
MRSQLWVHSWLMLPAYLRFGLDGVLVVQVPVALSAGAPAPAALPGAALNAARSVAVGGICGCVLGDAAVAWRRAAHFHGAGAGQLAPAGRAPLLLSLQL